MSKNKRVKLEIASKEFNEISKYLSKKGYEYSATGSLRRKRETVGDIDIIVKSLPEKVYQEILDYKKVVKKIDEKGNFLLKGDIKLQIIAEKDKYHYSLWTSTGNKTYINIMKEIIKEDGVKNYKKIKNEKEIYEKLNYKYLNPIKRDDIRAEKIEIGRKVVKKLKDKYGNPEVALNYNTDFQLLVAVILSAQCTDKRVNIVTEKLFKDYKTMEDFMGIPQKKLEKLIYSTGFYKNKAKNIKECSRQLIEEYNKEIPDNIKELTKLAGVGRKTANVIMGHVFKKPAIAVDTHVRRLSNRIGFVNMESPKKIEYYLKDIIRKKDWFTLSNLLITHGRRVCKARSYDCTTCILNRDCKLGRKNV